MSAPLPLTCRDDASKLLPSISVGKTAMADRNERNWVEHTGDAPPKAAWVSPAIARLDANDAEQGGSFNVDLGVTFS
ncbi:hypothetical protein [Sphingosinicella sp. LY1275]|uniref:hypothetical protein n=1 Tax=Sphingosinicella sp. LY1275 TaxID=3095379 RepID=UPI002ADEE551|nr:hypothetical protein [Sphingosinicella sp. LY1275]MEA1015634.1 hypothetical protein [Sphingosinicella sp. LY1275]